MGDSCWRGCDAHRWHAYVAAVRRVLSPRVFEEGEDARWLALDEALQLNLVFPARYMVENHAASLLQEP